MSIKLINTNNKNLKDKFTKFNINLSYIVM